MKTYLLYVSYFIDDTNTYGETLSHMKTLFLGVFSSAEKAQAVQDAWHPECGVGYCHFVTEEFGLDVFTNVELDTEV